MSYTDNCKTYRQDIIDRFEPAYVIENFFNEKEIEKLIKYQFKNAKRVKARPSSGNIQSVISVQRMMKNLKWLDDKFKAVFGEYNWIQTGNYYITIRHHDAHVDLISDEEAENPVFDQNIPFKSVVFPLYLSPIDAECYTAFMHQRRIGHAATFDRGSVSKQEYSSYKLFREYNGFIDINGNAMPSENDSADWSAERYPTITKENFSGFSEEIVFKQRVGDIMVFDACQVHASCQLDGTSDRWLKNGMNIQFYKTVEPTIVEPTQ